LYNTVEQVVQTGRAPAQPQSPYTPPQPAAPAPVADDAYLTGADFGRMAPQYVQQYVQPSLQQMQANVAQTALESVKNDPKFAPVFQKYGHEVYNKLASVDKSLWNVDNLRTIANLVKADHVEEIAAERAQRLFNEQVSTIRSTGAASAPVSPQQPDLSLKSERLSPEYREKLAAARLTESQLDDFCRNVGMTRAQWFAMAEKTGGIITEVSTKRARSGE
jgi:hypothetical protein